MTTGIRARVRHPIYLGHLCEIFGWCIGTGLIALYALAAFAIVTGVLMIRIEDRELEARFGEAYREYRAHSSSDYPEAGQVTRVSPSTDEGRAITDQRALAKVAGPAVCLFENAFPLFATMNLR